MIVVFWRVDNYRFVQWTEEHYGKLMMNENGVIMVNIDFIKGWIKGGGDVLYYCKMWTMIIISGRYGEMIFRENGFSIQTVLYLVKF